jgi:hypothetical protein
VEGLNPNLAYKGALPAFRKRLEPIIGNLEHVLEGMSVNKSVTLDRTPLLDMTLLCWEATIEHDTERVYELSCHNVVR